MILNGINFGTTFYGLYIVEHYGRRKSLMTGSAWMSMMFFIFANVGHFSLNRNDPQSTEKSGTAMIVIASFFIFGEPCIDPCILSFLPSRPSPSIHNTDTTPQASPRPGVP